jgi:phosphomannomutase
MINEAIFREYDIRGLAETELADPVVERIAMAAAAVYVREGKKEIAMGMDGPAPRASWTSSAAPWSATACR